MPELPEVQTLVDDLNRKGLAGCTLTVVSIFWPGLVSQLPPRQFCQRLTGRKPAAIRRRAKYIVCDLVDGGHLLLHLRMSGRLHWTSFDEKRLPHEHAIFHFGRHQLRFYDPRKFGRLYFVNCTDTFFKSLGPEPLEPGFAAAVFQKNSATVRV